MFAVTTPEFQHLLPLPGALGEILVAAQATGHLSRADRHGLQAAILHLDNLTEEERCTIDRLLRATKRGKISLCDDVSTLGS